MNNVSLLLTFLYELNFEKPKPAKLLKATKLFQRGLVSHDVSSLLAPYLLSL